MSENKTMVKKESLLYALFIGLVAGYIGGVVTTVYKMTPNSSTTDEHANHTQTANTNSPDQLQKQTAAAIANLEAELTANPDNADTWTQLGNIYYDSDQIEKAIEAYEKSLVIHPDNANVWTDMGVMYLKNKQPEKAIESFEQAYSIDPNHAPSRLNKGIVLLYDFHKHEEAIAAWEELLAINPGVKMNNGMPLSEAIEQLRQ